MKDQATPVTKEQCMLSPGGRKLHVIDKSENKLLFKRRK
jgi:hypothetical protein